MVDFAAATARSRNLAALGIRIFNKGDRDVVIPSTAIYVGRPTLYGNPFTHLPVKNTKAETHVPTREGSVKAYEIWARGKGEVDPAFRKAVIALYQKDLVCWCWPLDCHALILAKLAKEWYEEDALERVIKVL